MKLRYVDIQGFMSMDNILGKPHRLPLGDVTVLLGANGSGKSNVLTFFKMLRCLATGKLSDFVGKYGANRMLHYGSKYTPAISLHLVFDDGADNLYEAVLRHVGSDVFHVTQEKIVFSQKSPEGENEAPPARHASPDGTSHLMEEYFLSSDIRGEAGLAKDDSLHATGGFIKNFLTNTGIFQFHDTSENSHIRDRNYVDDAYITPPRNY